MSMRTKVTEVELLKLINDTLQKRGCRNCHLEALQAVANAGDGHNWRMPASLVDGCAGKCRAMTEVLCERLAASYSVDWASSRLCDPT